jgi:hypothetical protein
VVLDCITVLRLNDVAVDSEEFLESDVEMDNSDDDDGGEMMEELAVSLD